MHAVLDTDLRVQQAQVVVDLSDRRHGRLPAALTQALFDRHGGRDPRQVIDVRTCQDVDELPCIGRETVQVSPLSFCIEDVEGKCGLSRTAEPRDDDETVARQVDIEIFQIVFTCPDNPHDSAWCSPEVRCSIPDFRLSLHAGQMPGAAPFPCPTPVCWRTARSLQCSAQVMCCVRRLAGSHFFRCARSHNRTAQNAAFRSQVDHMVGDFHDLHVVFDHDQRVTAFDQCLHGGQQPFDVREVESDRRFVEQKQCARFDVLCHRCGQFQPLRFAARHGSERLAQMEVIESDIGQRLQTPHGVRLIGKKLECFVDRHPEDVMDGFAVPGDFQNLGAETGSVALRTGDVDVREKLHLDLLETLAITGRTTPIRHVEGELRRCVATQLRQGRLRKEIPDDVECFHVGNGIRTWCGSKW